ncbi:hypothetical protein Micbo1qcDRAFT_179169 [Microdochium bolleyi]|uniref:Uncharacterized protein n=1 Tax=Microdochium bolleyi TaxID=196109 RepID=A0A136IQT9_9PEZI|nr:hypothetical protein Micbo1qcDRAFT_179169 [Microdochium bolleyi]
MGFWSSLVEGAKSAGGWVLDHAGDIAGAVGTVARIAGKVILLEDGTLDHASHLEDFHKNFKLASFKLQQTAKGVVLKGSLDAKEAELRASNAHDYSAENVNLDSFTGVWKSPSTLVKGQPVVTMYSDLSKWLASLGVPATATVDIAQSFGKTIFANESSTLADPNTISSISFNISDPNGAWTLDCAHAYYALPLQAKVNDKCWHSCIYGKFHPSNKFLAMQALNRRKSNVSTIVRTNTVPKGTVATWIINATIDWGTTVIAAAIQDKFNKAWDSTGEKDKRTLVTSNLLGTSQSVQVQGNHTDDPSSIRQAVIQLAARTLTAYLAEAGGKPGNSGDIPDGTGMVEADWIDTLAIDGIDEPPVIKCTSATQGLTTASRATLATEMPTSVPQVRITKSQIVFQSE